jgi:predicted nucleic acid-binding protein
VTAKFVIADAGPLIALAVGGVLTKAIDMLGGVGVPEAVLQECVTDVSAPGAALISEAAKQPGFELIPSSALADFDSAFAQGLGSGEIAVLAYARLHNLLALIDERRARRVAQHLQIAVIGSGTVLAQLKLQGQIDSVKPVLELWRQHRYFISPAVERDIVLQAGELLGGKKLMRRRSLA